MSGACPRTAGGPLPIPSSRRWPSILGAGLLAQAAPPAYKPLRYEEDWSVLRDPALRGDLFDPLKFIPLAAAARSYLTLGPSVRAFLMRKNALAFDTQNDPFLEDAGCLENQVFASATVSVRF